MENQVFYKVSEQLLQAIGQYLITKPMAEVEGLVNGIRQVEKINENTEEEKESE